MKHQMLLIYYIVGHALYNNTYKENERYELT